MTSLSVATILAPSVAFARYKRGLVRASEDALMKERNREHLLRMKLGVGLVPHMLISHFPVVMDNPHIVLFSRITEFAVRADRIVPVSEVDSAHV
jgi:hypothetical protein